MKTFTLILKILAAVAAIAGIVFIVATYGDKIVAWAKKLLGRRACKGECDCCDEACFEDEFDDLDDESDDLVAVDGDFEE